MNERFVVLLRHGIAQPRGSEPDETRSLTDEGHRRMKQIGRALQLVFSKAEAIISSPLTRCVESAAWVAKAFDLAATTSDALRPEAGPDALRKLIDEISVRRFILVGHEPSLTEGMLHLTKMHSDGALELKRGGCYGIRFDESGEAALEWMLPPRVLRATQ
jgi:phosphohistidine phosphatase SixA